MIPDVSKDRLLKALAEFNEKYRDRDEWKNWADNRTHKFAVKSGDQLYPVKFIIELATGMSRTEFSGGDAPGQAAHFASNHGLEVIQLRSRNPNWTRDELILALDLYLQRSDQPPGKDSEEISNLSRELNALARSLGLTTQEDFRNPNGVYMKLMNFRRFDPNYTDQGKVGLTRGGKLEEVVWNEFAHNPVHCHNVADAIRSNIGEISLADDEGLDDGEEAEEGRILTAIHRRRERNRKIVKKKKDSVLRKTGELRCEACSFNFSEVYGERGDGYIECHHVKPVSESTGRTKLADLVLLCANCHRMVHAKRPWLGVDELITLLKPRSR